MLVSRCVHHTTCATATANLSLGHPLPVVLGAVLQVVANLYGLQMHSTSQAVFTSDVRETAAGASTAPAIGVAARLIAHLHTWTETTRVR